MKKKEKLIFSGPKALTNEELLSLMIGVNEESAREVFDYAEEIGESFGTMEVRDFMQIDGVGETKAASLIAGMELFRRMQSDKSLRCGEKIKDSRQVAEYLMSEFQDEPREHFVAINLNSKLMVLSRNIISIGTVDSTQVHPREVFAPAIRKGASAVIVAHTHPSGDPSPSPQDIVVTERLIAASEVIGIKLLDHVIIGNGCFTSMKSEGYFSK